MIEASESPIGSSEIEQTFDSSTLEVPAMAEPVVLADEMQEGGESEHHDRVQLLADLDNDLKVVVPEATNRRDLLKAIVARVTACRLFARYTMQGIATAEAINASTVASESSGGGA